MPLDAIKACERDLKRFDDLTNRFETTGLVLGFLNILLAVWVRAPGLQMDPGSAVGLSVGGFNVGYAIVYGPIVSFLGALLCVSILERRDQVRAQLLRLDARSPDVFSDGDRVAIACGIDGDAALRRIDVAWRTIWYVCVPPIAATIMLRRYFDFVPDEPAKAWTLLERVKYLLFNTAGWETQPILPSHALEVGKDTMSKLPYIYPPAGSWLSIAFVLGTVIMAVRIWRLYACPGTANDFSEDRPKEDGRDDLADGPAAA